MKDVPQRGDAWLTLTLANYRNGNWRAAEDAEQNSAKFTRRGESNAVDWLLLSMIRGQQGRTNEACRLHKKAGTWIAENKPKDKDLDSLAAEAAELIHCTHVERSTSITTTEQTP